MSESDQEGREVRLARSGAPAALGELYRRYADDVYRVACRVTGSSADAEDVLQDVFLALPHTIRRFDGRGPFGGWLRSVAIHTAMTKLRRRKARRELRLDWLVPHPSSQPPDTVQRVDLERALATLSDGLRVVFVLKEIEGYTHREIAALLGIRVSTSEVRLHRARAVLRRHLGP